MEREILSSILKFRSWFQSIKVIGAVRHYSNLPERMPEEMKRPRHVQKQEKAEAGLSDLSRHSSFADLEVKHWNEFIAVRRQRKTQTVFHRIKNVTDLLEFLQSWKNFPLSLSDLRFYFKRKWRRIQLAEQKYMPQRVAVLKPDLAAAHFLLRRGGLVQFVGSEQWVGPTGDKRTVPLAYIPGMFIKAIRAENTGLLYEGLANLSNLKYLASLSLKNLDTIDDWCLDYISKEFYLTLQHLDISGCKNITYRGLSCFYKFECLETLNVKGIPDTPEFKLACLLLLDFMPNLDIQGIDLTVPEEIIPEKIEKVARVNADIEKHRPESEIPV